MFSKTSRYHRLPDMVTIDARGTSAESKTLRLLPEVTGIFFHTVEEADRLDHLAYKYYRQPTLWWRICDANPEIASPRELVGREPIVTFRFPLGTGDAADRPPWSELLRRVGDLVGVEHAAAEEEPAELVVAGETAGDPVYAERYERALTVRFNRLSVSLEEVIEEVSAAAAAAGLRSGPPTAIGRVGKRITIPPRPAGARS